MYFFNFLKTTRQLNGQEGIDKSMGNLFVIIDGPKNYKDTPTATKLIYVDF